MNELTYKHKRSLGEFRHTVDTESFFDDIVPLVVTEVIQAFAAELSPLPPVHVPLRKDDNAVYGWPADGIREKIRADGGSILFGWRLREWPRVVLTAEFHAVWVDPEGTLIDITCDVADGDTSLFVPDPSYSETFGPDQRPSTRYHVLHAELDRSEAIAERIVRLKPGQRVYEERRAAKAGKTLEEWIRDKFFADHLSGRINAYIKACDGFDAKLPTLPSLIQTDPRLLEEKRPTALSDARGEAEGLVAATDGSGATATDAARGAHEEAGTVEPQPPAEAAQGHADDTVTDTPIEAAGDEADDDEATNDAEEPLDETWLAEDNLERWSRDRETCREAILQMMPEA